MITFIRGAVQFFACSAFIFQRQRRRQVVDPSPLYFRIFLASLIGAAAILWMQAGWNRRQAHALFLAKRSFAPMAETAKKMDPVEYARTSAKKRADSENGKQFSRQPADVAAETANKRRS